MRTIYTMLFTALTAFAGFLFTSDVQAKCAYQGVYFSPKAKTSDVPRNVKPFLSLYGASRGIIPYLNKVTLSSKGHHIPVKIETLNPGVPGMRMRYIYLKPQSPLKANRTYHLQVNRTFKAISLSAKADWQQKHILKGMREGGSIRTKLEKYSFTTGNNSDTKAPAPPQKLSTTGYRYARMGCGPSRQIPIKMSGLQDDTTPNKALMYLVEAAIQTKTGKRTIAVYTGVNWRPNHTYLGHGMCSGNVATLPKGRYIITVRAVDFAGNLSKPSPAIKATVN